MHPVATFWTDKFDISREGENPIIPIPGQSLLRWLRDRAGEMDRFYEATFLLPGKSVAGAVAGRAGPSRRFAPFPWTVPTNSCTTALRSSAWVFISSEAEAVSWATAAFWCTTRPISPTPLFTSWMAEDWSREARETSSMIFSSPRNSSAILATICPLVFPEDCGSLAVNPASKRKKYFIISRSDKGSHGNIRRGVLSRGELADGASIALPSLGRA